MRPDAAACLDEALSAWTHRVALHRALEVECAMAHDLMRCRLGFIGDDDAAFLGSWAEYVRNATELPGSDWLGHLRWFFGRWAFANPGIRRHRSGQPYPDWYTGPRRPIVGTASAA